MDRYDPAMRGGFARAVRWRRCCCCSDVLFFVCSTISKVCGVELTRGHARSRTSCVGRYFFSLPVDLPVSVAWASRWASAAVAPLSGQCTQHTLSATGSWAGEVAGRRGARLLLRARWAVEVNVVGYGRCGGSRPSALVLAAFARCWHWPSSLVCVTTS